MYIGDKNLTEVDGRFVLPAKLAGQFVDKDRQHLSDSSALH